MPPRTACVPSSPFFFYGAVALLWLRFGLGVDISSILATSAVVSLILGFALQATLGNFFSGISLEIERPIRVGDFIQKGPVEGRVEALKWRSLFILTERNTRVILPNTALTGDAVEIFRGDLPSRCMAVFTVAASVPPMEVLSVATKVLKSGLPDICDDPPPSAVLLGPEPYSGCLRYGARFYTLAYLNRSATASSLLVRLWYALSRKGISMSPASAAAVREDGEVVPLSLSGFSGAAPFAPIVSGLPEDFAGRLQTLGRRLRYGPGERIDLEGGAAVVFSGSAREEVRIGEQDMAGALAELLAAPLTPQAAPIISERLQAEIAARAAAFIGPVAHTLAAQYGAHTDDPFLLFRALAEHFPDAEKKARFLSASPDYPTRRLNPGALFGWAAVLGVEPPGLRHPISNNSVEILLLSPKEVRALLSGAEDSAAAILAAEPGLRGLTAEALREWLQQAA
jgi:hypothetical protein